MLKNLIKQRDFMKEMQKRCKKFEIRVSEKVGKCCII